MLRTMAKRKKKRSTRVRERESVNSCFSTKVFFFRYYLKPLSEKKKKQLYISIIKKYRINARINSWNHWKLLLFWDKNFWQKVVGQVIVLIISFVIQSVSHCRSITLIMMKITFEKRNALDGEPEQSTQYLNALGRLFRA